MCSHKSAPAGEKPLEELEEEICQLAAHIAAAVCRWLVLLAEWDERLGWAEWGVKSCAHWLSWRCSIGLKTAQEHVRVARRLIELPLVRESFASGVLSYSKVRAITRVATAKTEAQLVELAEHATGAQLERVVRGFRRALRASNENANASHEARSFDWERADDGSVVFRGRLPAEQGALLLAALERAESWTAPEPAARAAEGRGGCMDPSRPTVDQRRADALAAVAECALAADAAPTGAGQACEVMVHVDAETLVADEAVGRSELEQGGALAPETVRRLACDAAVVRVVERDGKPLTVGRRTRAISPALRRALRSRDQGCQFPGCTHTRFLHAHHIQHWARGGPTDLDNLVQLCSYHHRLVHEGGFVVEHEECRGGDAGRRRRGGRVSAGKGPKRGAVRFRRPDGEVIPAVCEGRAARGTAIDEWQAAAGIEIDGDTCRARSAGMSLDYDIAVQGLIFREEDHPSYREPEEEEDPPEPGGAPSAG